VYKSRILILSKGCKLGFILLFTSFVGKGQITMILQVSNTVCGYRNGTIFAQVSGGTAPYSFSNNGGPSQTSPLFSGLIAGKYKITVTDKNGKTTSVTTTLTNTYSPPTVAIVKETEPGSCTAFNGSLTLAAKGGTPQYTYGASGSSSQTSPVFTGLSPGTYTVFATDANTCVGSQTIVLLPPCGATGVTISNSGSVCSASGYVTATPKAGAALPFTYSLVGTAYPATAYQSSPSFTNLPSGFYHLTAKDAKGASYIYAFTIDQHCSLPATTTTTPSRCTNNDGTIAVSVTGAKMPVFYEADDNGYQENDRLTGLSSGNHTVYVIDAYLNTDTLTATVGSYCPVLTVSSTPSTCTDNNGTITVTNASGGTDPVLFSLDGVHFQSAKTFTGLAPGNYTVTSKDAANVLTTAMVTIATLSGPTLNVATTATGCGGGTGGILATATGGAAPLSYSLNGGAGQATGSFSGLSAGDDLIVVSDANGCKASQEVTITTAIAPTLTLGSIPASCLGTDGTVTALIDGGLAPIGYSLDNGPFQAAASFVNVGVGDHTVVAQDANGCSATQAITVGYINDLTVNAGTATAYCAGGADTLAGSTASSETATAVWSPAAGLSNVNSLTPLASPSTTTTYYLTATAGLCTAIDSVIVPVDSLPIPNAGNDTTVCSGQNVTLQAAGGVVYTWTPTTYLNNPGIANPTVVQPVQTITYQLTVIDSNGCHSAGASSITVSVVPETKVFVGSDTAILANQPFPLYAQDVNNSGFTNFSWSPATGLNDPNIQDPIATIDQEETYVVTASTSTGCSASGSIKLEILKMPDIFVPNAFTPNGDGHNDVLHALPKGIKVFDFMAVYNRLGQRVFFTKNPETGWDGTVNGERQPAGSYVWMAEGIDVNDKIVQRKGVVILIR
jgi:gliding motility-associated-like protein